MEKIENCTECDGDGQIINGFGFPEECYLCDGSGYSNSN